MSYLFHTYYMPHRSHFPLFGHQNNIWYRSSGRAVWSACVERLYTGLRVRISLKAWMFVLVSLCCVVLCG
jgi:hypothetical protein